MRSSFSLLAILLACPLLALAQSSSLTDTNNSSSAAPVKAAPKTLTRTAPADAAATPASAEDQNQDQKAADALARWAAPRLDVSAAPLTPHVTLGRSDFVVSGPLLDAVRLTRRDANDASLGKRILGLPIINIFVPGPMPKPLGHGAYFSWGERDVAWTTMCEPPHAGAVGVLVSVNR